MAIRSELRRARAGLQLAADSRGPARSCPDLRRAHARRLRETQAGGGDQGHDTGCGHSPDLREQEETSYEHDVSVFPLAIPLIAGPKAITTILLYTGGTDLAGTAVFVGILLITLAVQFVFDGLESILA